MFTNVTGANWRPVFRAMQGSEFTVRGSFGLRNVGQFFRLFEFHGKPFCFEVRESFSKLKASIM